jgi:hypothetical protein
MPTVADYEDAVRRIAGAEVEPSSTTAAQVRSDLHGSSAPQLTPEVAEGVADAIVTEERVIDAIEATGELPTEAEIPAITSVADDYELDDRVSEVAESVSKRVATVEEVQAAVRERQEQADGPTFRQHVETAVNEVERSGQQFVGASPGEVASQQAREIGAPSETNFNRAATQATMPDDAVSPADLGVGSQDTAVNVIEDESGQPLVAFGGAGEIDGRPAGEVVAEEIGAEYAGTGTDALDDVRGQFDVEGAGETVALTFRGRKVGEVDVE